MSKHRVYKDGSGREFDVREVGECQWQVKPVEPILRALHESATIQVKGSAVDAQYVISANGEVQGGNDNLSVALGMAADLLTHIRPTENAKIKKCATMHEWMNAG